MLTDRLGALDTLRGPHVGVIEPGMGLDPRALESTATQALRDAVVDYGGLLLLGLRWTPLSSFVALQMRF